MISCNRCGKGIRSKSPQSLNRPGLAAVLLLLAAVTAAGSAAWASQPAEANAGKGGEPLEVASLAAPGQTTLIEFYSPYCPPCLQLAPLLEQLAQKKAGLAIKKVNINRPEVKGIDWHSPLAKQYGLRSVPYFLIFNPSGKQVSKDKAATRQVGQWLKEAGLIKE